MITLRKLASLKPDVRRRKTFRLVQELEKGIMSGNLPDTGYLQGLCGRILEDGWSAPVLQEAGNMRALLAAGAGPEAQLTRALNALRHALGRELGLPWADWDAFMPLDADEEYCPRHPFRVYLDGIRSPFNVGSIMRTAAAFGVEKIWVSPDCASPHHPRCRRSSMGMADKLPWSRASAAGLEEGETGTLFALETGGCSLSRFSFPRSGTVIVGSEELGVSPELLARARSAGGIVSIPLGSAKASLNVGVAFGILMESWQRLSA